MDEWVSEWMCLPACVREYMCACVRECVLYAGTRVHTCLRMCARECGPRILSFSRVAISNTIRRTPSPDRVANASALSISRLTTEASTSGKEHPTLKGRGHGAYTIALHIISVCVVARIW